MRWSRLQNISCFMLLLLLLSRFSHVQLCAAHQAPPPLGFSRKEHWSGLPFPSPVRESEVAQSCPTSCDPMDCSLRGCSIHGICQAQVLEWVATVRDKREWVCLWPLYASFNFREAIGAVSPALTLSMPYTQKIPGPSGFMGKLYQTFQFNASTSRD